MKLARMPDGGPEIFPTLQGEGRNTGLSCVFIRASLCNLRCRWCDTPYTWNWDDREFDHEDGRKYSREEEILDLSPEEVATRAAEFGSRAYVFTGGEPLLQERAWVEVMDRLRRDHAADHFEVESNGTLLPGEAFLESITQLNLSPKLANAGMDPELRLAPGVLRALAETGKADFKFVVQSEADLEEIRALADEARLPADRIFLMPRARTPEELEKNQHFAAEAARKCGYCYSDRLHLRLYGATRGT